MAKGESGTGVLAARARAAALPQHSAPQDWSLRRTEMLEYGPLFGPKSEFSRIGRDAMADLARAFVPRTYVVNDFIYLQDDQADNIFFIRSGFVRLSHLMEDGSAILYAILPPGESFGELGVFEGGAHCDTATAASDVTVASVPTQLFRSLGARHPEINAAVARVVA